MKGGLLITLLRGNGKPSYESDEDSARDDDAGVGRTIRTAAARAIREAISAGDDEKLAEALHEFVSTCE